MTHEQEKALHDFEALVRRLMKAHERLRAENEELRNEIDGLNRRLEEERENVARLKRDYAVLKTARMIEVGSDDVKEAQARIAKLIREVDKCIALLNV